MARYVIVTDDDTVYVEAKNRTEAARDYFKGADGGEATIYRVIDDPVRVRITTETVTKVEIE